MIRFILFFICLSNFFYLQARSKEEIDQFNQETITLLDDLDSCLVRANYAIEEAEGMGYEYGLGYALYLKGYIHRKQNELGKAFLAYLKGLNVLQDLDDDRVAKTLISLFVNTGEILKKHFKYEEALQYYAEGLAIAESEGLSNLIMQINYGMGYAYQAKGDLDQAIFHTQKSYKLAEIDEDEFTTVNALNLMGLISKDRNSYDTAALFFHKMIAYDYTKLSVNEYKGLAWHNLANTYAKQGDTTNALIAFEKGIGHLKILNEPTAPFITENDLAELYYSLGEYSKADEAVRNCLTTYEEMRLDPDHYKVFDLARKIQAARGNYSLADDYAGRYVEENQKFIKEQADLIEVRDQFKMEVLTAGFFGELERNKRIARLQTAIIWISILSVLIIGYIKARQLWVKRVIKKELIQLSGGSF